MDHLGATDLMRAALTQGQQAGGVIDLAVQQNDGTDGGIAWGTGRLQRRERLQLSADVRRGITQNPVDTVITDGDRRLGTRLRIERAGAQAGAVGAIAVPLRKTAARDRKSTRLNSSH